MKVERVLVAGAGLMGHGIAQVHAAVGKQLLLYEPEISRATAGRDRVGANLQRAVDKQRLTAEERDAILERIAATDRLEDAASLIRELGSDSVRIGADSFHMNIEEPDPALALIAAAPLLGHVQVSDSNRQEPGAGHLDWPLFLTTLTAIGYTGPIALEARLSGAADRVAPSVPGLLRRYL